MSGKMSPSVVCNSVSPSVCLHLLWYTCVICHIMSMCMQLYVRNTVSILQYILHLIVVALNARNMSSLFICNWWLAIIFICYYILLITILILILRLFYYNIYTEVWLFLPLYFVGKLAFLVEIFSFVIHIIHIWNIEKQN